MTAEPDALHAGKECGLCSNQVYAEGWCRNADCPLGTPVDDDG